MKSIFDASTVSNFSKRIDKLNNGQSAIWGKMSAYQMLRHCVLSEHMYLGDNSYNRLFIGKLFGKMALKSILKDDSPLKKNQPTHPEFKIVGEGDITPLQKDWKELLKRYLETPDKSFSGFIHPFFGPMSKEQIGQYVYKHTDHHLRQFGI